MRKQKTEKRRHQPSEDGLLGKEARYCSWGDTVHYASEPKVFSAAEGSYLYDQDGTGYLDLQMWYSAVNFGYRNSRLSDALKNQLDVLPQLACQYLHKEKIELAALLCRRVQMTFESRGRVHFNVGGSAAIEDALKLVRRGTGRNLMFSFMGSYHGRTLAATSITSSFRYREPFGHFGERACFIPFPYCFRCPYNKKRDYCDLYCLSQFERLFETEYHTVCNPRTRSCEFGAFFIEPVQGTGGYVIPPHGYFSGLKDILDRYGILMVDDEVQMGFFRTGKFWAIEHFNTIPDVIVFGKSLTNGLNPLSGIWARERLINPASFPPGSTHSTFSSNPLGTAVGLETMRLIEESDLAADVPRKGEYFLSRLKHLSRRYPQIGDVDGLGLALRVEMCHKDGFTPDRELTDEIVRLGLGGRLTAGGKRRGLILDVGGYYKNVFTLAPSLFIDDAQIDLACDLFEEALAKAAGSGG